jgi:prepilin-type processing-associated H-X9-DG protein
MTPPTQPSPTLSRQREMNRFAVKLAVVLLIGFVLLRGYNNLSWSSGDSARESNCSSNLKQVGLALTIYAKAHNNAYPPTLADVLVEGELTKEAMTCPSDTQPDWLGFRDRHPDTGDSYIYCGSGFSMTSPETVILAYERDGHHQLGMRAFLFADGHVERIWNPTAGAIVSELERGHNPPRAQAVRDLQSQR